jgi:nucleoid DNA-binding protein
MNKSIKKEEMVSNIQKDLDSMNYECSKRMIGDIIDVFINNIKDIIIDKDEYNIWNFGRFYAEGRKAETVRAPNINGTVDLPDRTIPKFKFGKTFKKEIRFSNIEQ